MRINKYIYLFQIKFDWIDLKHIFLSHNLETESEETSDTESSGGSGGNSVAKYETTSKKSILEKITDGTNVAKQVINTFKEGIGAAHEFLDLYDRLLDRVVPYKEFEATVKDLDKFREDYSKESADLLGKIKTFMLDGMDAYHRSVQIVYEWTGLAGPLLKTYIKLFERNDEDKANAQKQILLKVLDDGIKSMKQAQIDLDKSSSRFNDAAGELTSLNIRLAGEFDSKSSYFDSKVTKMRIMGYGGGLILGPFGLGIAYIVLEKNIIPDLTKTFEGIKKFYEDMTTKVSEAFTGIDTTKDKLTQEIRVVGNLKVQTQETQTMVFHNIADKEDIIESANELIIKCKEYRDRHRM